MSLKEFQILQEIGKGSFSCVYKVKRIVDNQIYAMKKIKTFMLNKKDIENSLNEIYLLSNLDSEFIIKYKDSFYEQNNLYIIMEYAQKGDLQQMIDYYKDKNQFIKEEMIWKTLADILQGLELLHNKNIYHRDLKSANVFISNCFKLGDLNVSKQTNTGLAYTQTGTPYYASPEVWRDEPYNGKSDIWSMGCVIYEMCTLLPPFHADTMNDLFELVQKGQFQRIPKIYSNSLQSVIEQMLTVNIQQRPSVQKLLQYPKIKLYLKNKNNSQSKQQIFSENSKFKNISEYLNNIPRPKYDQNIFKIRSIQDIRIDKPYKKISTLNNIPEKVNKKKADLILPSKIIQTPNLKENENTNTNIKKNQYNLHTGIRPGNLIQRINQNNSLIKSNLKNSISIYKQIISQQKDRHFYVKPKFESLKHKYQLNYGSVLEKDRIKINLQNIKQKRSNININLNILNMKK